jgi:hypothetical protein
MGKAAAFDLLRRRCCRVRLRFWKAMALASLRLCRIPFTASQAVQVSPGRRNSHWTVLILRMTVRQILPSFDFQPGFVPSLLKTYAAPIALSADARWCIPTIKNNPLPFGMTG